MIRGVHFYYGLIAAAVIAAGLFGLSEKDRIRGIIGDDGIKKSGSGLLSAETPSAKERSKIEIIWPSKIRAGDSGKVSLSLDLDNLSEAVPTSTGPNIFDTHNVVAYTRLELPGVYIEPAWELYEPVHPGSQVQFSWEVLPEEIGRYEGTVWLYLHFVPLGEGEAVTRAISAQDIEFETVSLFGLNGATARVIGTVGVFAALFLLFSDIEKLITSGIQLFRIQNQSK